MLSSQRSNRLVTTCTRNRSKARTDHGTWYSSPFPVDLLQLRDLQMQPGSRPARKQDVITPTNSAFKTSLSSSLVSITLPTTTTARQRSLRRAPRFPENDINRVSCNASSSKLGQILNQLAHVSQQTLNSTRQVVQLRPASVGQQRALEA